MNSATILNDYLLSKSRVEDILPLEAFQKEFPKGTSKSLIEAIYKELVSQRQTILEDTRGKVTETFDLPIEKLIKLQSSISQDRDIGLTSKSTLENLVERLENLLQELHTDSLRIDNHIRDEIKLLYILVDELSDLRHSKKKLDKHAISNLLVDASKSARKLETSLNNS